MAYIELKRIGLGSYSAEFETGDDPQPYGIYIHNLEAPYLQLYGFFTEDMIENADPEDSGE